MTSGTGCGSWRASLDIPVIVVDTCRPFELFLSFAFMNTTIFLARQLATELPKAAPMLVPTIDATGKSNSGEMSTTSSFELDETITIRASSALPSIDPTVAPTDAPADAAMDATRSLAELPPLVSPPALFPVCMWMYTTYSMLL